MSKKPQVDKHQQQASLSKWGRMTPEQRSAELRKSWATRRKNAEKQA